MQLKSLKQLGTQFLRVRRGADILVSKGRPSRTSSEIRDKVVRRIGRSLRSLWHRDSSGEQGKTGMPEHIYKVPADTRTVEQFVRAERDRFVEDLSSIKKMVSDALVGMPVYKIYGRDEKQAHGDPIKHPRKIRLKFNDYFGKRGDTTASLWTVPDIIGFTVVVPYPTDISSICTVIDLLVDRLRLVAAEDNADGTIASTAGPTQSRVPTSAPSGLPEAGQTSGVGASIDERTDKAKSLIASKHGRPIISGGYFACHYNVRLRGPSRHRPICEIQIKTVLHDAWGAKTHDLTYKPSGRTNRDLIDSFNLLGDTLAQLDRQSDLIRSSIQRSAAPREQKRRDVQTATIEMATTVFSTIPELSTLAASIAALTRTAVDAHTVDDCIDRLYGLFDRFPKEVCYLFALLSIRTRDDSVRQRSLEALETWYEGLHDPLEQIYSRNVAGLLSYCGGDLTSAIEFCEQAVPLAEELLNSGYHPQGDRLRRLANSLFSCLAYYHADIIGSHEGGLAQSQEKCLAFLTKATVLRDPLGFPSNGILSEDIELSEALKAESHKKVRTYQTLENEAFVKIQTAQSIDDLRVLVRKLTIIQDNRPEELLYAAKLFDNYHDYCARIRMSELETDQQ